MLVSLLGLALSLYSLGYAPGLMGRKRIGILGAFFNVLLLATTLVFLAHNAFFFLLAWEVMAMTAFCLVSFEHEKDEACAAICPLLSHVFASTQTKLGKEADKVHLVSVSIDPEQDTPARLSEYAKKFKAGKGWQFYTGTTKASIDLQKAFNTFRGDKMNHLQLIFYRVTPGKPWVRLEGFASADDLIREFHNDSKEASAKDK